MRTLRTALMGLPVLLCTGACFEGPERLDPIPQQAPARPAQRPVDASQGLPAGHPPLGNEELPHGHPPLDGQMPSGHPPLPGPHGSMPTGMPHGGQGTGSGEPLFGGRIELAGELAQEARGGVFLVARAPGQSAMLLVRKLDVSGGELGPDGQRILAFQLSDQDSMGGPVPAEIRLEVYFDPDGIVETKEGRVTRVFDAQRGDLGLTLVLDPAAASPAGAGGY